MIHSDLEELRALTLIKDDTVFDESNLQLFITKMLYCSGGESISVEAYTDEEKKLKSLGLTFETREHKIMLHIGDKWLRVRRFLEIDTSIVFDCPICLEDINYKTCKRVMGCPECNVSVCVECSIKQMISNQGMFVCCNCRHALGTRMPDYLVHQAARRIRLEYNI